MRICVIEDCNNECFVKGFCAKHYRRYYRYGDPYFTKDHGMCNTPTYITWRMMIQRCTNINTPCYKNYGGRGIMVCNRWKNSFLAFLKDMGKRPDSLQLDRINNDGNYEPNNCHWVTIADNNRNTRRTVLSIGIANEIRQLSKKGLGPKAISEKLNIKKHNVGDVLYKNCWG